MRIVLTGAAGFLGWHTRVRLRALTAADVVPVTRASWDSLAGKLASADAVIHLAGVNRGSSTEVEEGNIRLAEELAASLQQSGGGRRVVYANSIQAGSPSSYGTGKERAAELLREAAEASSGTFVDVRLPNLFGEHGRPHYNSFVATFVDCVRRGDLPTILDREVRLLHAQDAAQTLMDALESPTCSLSPPGEYRSVQEVYDLLNRFRDIYRRSDVPALSTKFELDLFNTFRAGLFPQHFPLRPSVHTDGRGRLVETVRSHGGQGQVFVSTTRPGVSRGEHFHLSKVERFTVLSGRARICVRRLFHDEVTTFDVRGSDPVAVDMPTMWAHSITNTGGTDLVTLFWTNSLYDPAAPDTYKEVVGLGHGENV